MILDAYGRPVSDGPQLGGSLRFLDRYIAMEVAQRAQREADLRVRDLRESVGATRMAGVGQTIHVKLPERYR